MENNLSILFFLKKAKKDKAGSGFTFKYIFWKKTNLVKLYTIYRSIDSFPNSGLIA